MRIVNFKTANVGNGSARPGLIDGDEVIDLSDSSIGLPENIMELFDDFEQACLRAERGRLGMARRFALGEIEFCAPVPRPPKFLGIGMNYHAHVKEMGRQAPEHQYWFNKQRTCVIGPNESILIPSCSEMVDYEGELGIVISKKSQNVPGGNWRDFIAGYIVVNDVSTRDWQFLSPTFTLGKSFDTHGPIGPAIVTSDEIDDPLSLKLVTTVNGEIRQNASTSDLIFKPDQMFELLSQAFTLEPGDILATGTPAGVGASFDPPRWLKSGDTVTISIEGVGELSNPVK